MDTKPNWMSLHEQSDLTHFGNIEHSLHDLQKDFSSLREEMNTHMEEIKPYIEAATAFKLGSKGAAWFTGFLVAVGSLIYLTMQILGKR